MSMRAMMIKAAKEATGNESSKMIFKSIKQHKVGEKTEDELFKQPAENTVLVTAKL